YSISGQGATTASVTPKALTVSGITAADKVYDGAVAAAVSTTQAVYAGLVGCHALVVTASGQFDNKNAGTGKTVALASSYSGADVGNYSISGQGATTASVTPKALTVSGITAADKVYDGGVAAAVSTTHALYTGLVGGDALQVSASGQFDNKNAGTGKTVALASGYSGADVGNYSISGQGSTTASVTPKALTVSGITAADKVYDGTMAAAVNTTPAVYAGLVGGDNLSVAASGQFDNKNAGTAKTVALASSYSGADVGNYSISGQGSTTASVTPKALTVSGITAADKVYDGDVGAAVSTANAVYAGLVGGDALVVAASGTFDNKNAGTAKTLALASSYSGADVGNYSISGQGATTASVTPKALTVSGITAADKVYDGTMAAAVSTANALYTGLLGGDNLSVASANGNFADKNVGTGKTVTVSNFVLGGADASNYSFNGLVTTTASVTPKALMVSATGVNKNYDATTTASVILHDNRIAGDAISFGPTLADFNDALLGSGKTVFVRGIQIAGGADMGNYVLDSTSTTTFADITSLAEQVLLPAPPVQLSSQVVTPPPAVLDLALPVGFGSGAGASTNVTVRTGMTLGIEGPSATLTLSNAGSGTGEARPTQTSDVPLFSLTGNSMRSTGTLNVLQQGPTLKGTQTPTDTAVTPTFDVNAMRFAKVSHPVSDGEQSEVKVWMSQDGVLLVRVLSRLKNAIDDRQIALIGIATAQINFGVDVKSVKSVVIELDQ
ncbi:MAG: YDG domain-containing protein, partial [Rhodoferax sp.]